LLRDRPVAKTTTRSPRRTNSFNTPSAGARWPCTGKLRKTAVAMVTSSRDELSRFQKTLEVKTL
jgi:hypothetical protein